jgi:hypothetical protein
MSKINEILDKLNDWWFWFKNLFLSYYELTVSYNSIYGDGDDEIFTVAKFYKKQDKYLKFKTEDGDIVEIRGAEGLNYKIKEL